MRRILISTLALAFILVQVSGALGLAEKGAGPEGTWEGKLKAQLGIELRLVLHVSPPKAAGGPLHATLDSVDQGAKGLEVDSVAVQDGALVFEMKKLGAKFRGTLNAEGTEAVGRWEQSGLSLPLTLKKTDKPSELRRPQEPRPPFPYEAEDVSYENRTAGIKLAGTLTKPKGAGPYPAVILISGSGPQDRDESILGHKPFLVLADALTRRGIAVLRFDDRGVGGSTGKTMSSTSEDLAGDVLAGVAFLKARPEIDSRAIGLIGHSEGGIIAPMVAARSSDVAFIVLMAGTGMGGEEILVRQGALIFKALGLKDKRLAQISDLQKRAIAIAKEEKDDKVVAEKLRAIAREQMAALPEDQAKEVGDLDKLAEVQIEMLRSPWFRFFLNYDPRPTLAKVRCPVLAICGEHDLQVPPKENLEAIEAALHGSGNKRVTVRELPGLNHLFQTSQTGSPAEYAQIEETIAPSALKLMGDWIEEQVQERKKD
jgi:pimeloyl-ACP methyl ester carboxylesterase